MTTDEETEEIEPGRADNPVKPKRINGPDLAVLGLEFAHNIFDALVLSLERALIVVGAHANYRTQETERSQAINAFHQELDWLPTAAAR